MRPFNIMAKPVSGVCNLDCRYCYYTSKPRDLYPGADKFLMPPEVLESFIRQYIQACGDRCEFAWQGGEPLLAGLEFFRRAVALQRQFAPAGTTIANAIQTNGTLLDDAWCEFLAEYKFLVGISIDGPPQWHDAFRRDRSGGTTHHRAWAGLELLQKHHVEFNVLVTLNSANAPHAADLYRYFVNRGIQYLQFIPVLERDGDGRVAEYSCTGEQFGQFLIDVFRLWAQRDVGRVSERFIDGVLHRLIFGASSMCCYAERCANAHVLEHNGDLYACDHFVYPQWKIGNILRTPLAELLAGGLLDEFARLKTDLSDACRTCEFLEFCRGGCPKHHVPIGTGNSRVNHFCEGYKRFFREALGELKLMAKQYKQGDPPPAALRQSPPAAPAFPKAPAAKRSMPVRLGQEFKTCCGK